MGPRREEGYHLVLNIINELKSQDPSSSLLKEFLDHLNPKDPNTFVKKLKLYWNKHNLDFLTNNENLVNLLDIYSNCKTKTSDTGILKYITILKHMYNLITQHLRSNPNLDPNAPVYKLKKQTSKPLLFLKTLTNLDKRCAEENYYKTNSKLCDTHSCVKCKTDLNYYNQYQQDCDDLKCIYPKEEPPPLPLLPPPPVGVGVPDPVPVPVVPGVAFNPEAECPKCADSTYYEKHRNYCEWFCPSVSQEKEKEKEKEGLTIDYFVKKAKAKAKDDLKENTENMYKEQQQSEAQISRLFAECVQEMKSAKKGNRMKIITLTDDDTSSFSDDHKHDDVLTPASSSESEEVEKRDYSDDHKHDDVLTPVSFLESGGEEEEEFIVPSSPSYFPSSGLDEEFISNEPDESFG